MKRKVTPRSVLNTITSIVLVLLIVVVVFVFISRLTGHVPSIFGYTIYRIQTDSMEPALQVGDVILDKKIAADEIKKGDIITYDCETGELIGQTITHRVVAEPELRNGTYYYQTQGDKDGSVPDGEISYDQVEGIFVCKIAWLDGIYNFFLSPYGLLVFILVILVLFGYEMVALLVSYKSLDEKDDDYYEPKAKKPSKKRKKK